MALCVWQDESGSFLHVLPLLVQVLWKVQRWSEALQTLLNEQVSYCVFHTHVCMCKACESSIRRSLKKHRHCEPFRFRWDEGNESVAFHFVRQLMLKLASMLCVGIGRIVCSTSLQLCLCTQHYQLVYYMTNVRESDTIHVC